MARGAFPDSHPQHLGMPGMHGTVAAVGALQRSDLLIALGARFDDRVTGKLDTFAPDAKVIHADIDPAEISKNRVADVPIVGDAKEVIADLIVALKAEHEAGSVGDYDGWWPTLNQWRDTTRSATTTPDDGRSPPQYVIERLGEIAGPDAIYAAGVGQHQMWAAQFVGYEQPGHLAQLRRPRHHGLRGARGDGRQGRPPGHDRLGDRRRRLLPDDQPGARHLRDQRHPDQGRGDQQQQPRHGPAVADAVLREPLLQHRPAQHAGSPTSSSSPRRTAASGCAASPPATSTR